MYVLRLLPEDTLRHWLKLCVLRGIDKKVNGNIDDEIVPVQHHHPGADVLQPAEPRPDVRTMSTT